MSYGGGSGWPSIVLGPGADLHNKFHSRLHKCEEVANPVCTPSDGLRSTCCGIMPCKFCVSWEVYGDVTRYGTMTLVDTDDARYTGTVDGMSVVMERYVDPYNHNVCRFRVIVDGEEIFDAPQCPVYGSDVDYVSCRNPAGSVEFERVLSDGYEPDTENGVLSWGRETEHQLIEQPGTASRPPTNCKIDVIVVYDKTWRLERSLFDLKERIEADFLIPLVASPVSFRLGLVEVGRTTHSITLPLGGTMNGSAFLTAVNGLTLESNTDDPSGGALVHTFCNIGAATDDIVAGNAGRFRATAEKHVIMAVGNMPHYGDESQDAADLTRHEAAVAALKAGDVTTSVVHLNHYSGEPPTAFYHSGAAAHFASIASIGGGGYLENTSDGFDDLQGGDNTLCEQLEAAPGWDLTCVGEPGRCAENFCGNCRCVCDKLCFTWRWPASIVEGDATPPCEAELSFTGEFCEDRATSASWAGQLTCPLPFVTETEEFRDVTLDVVVTLGRATYDIVPDGDDVDYPIETGDCYFTIRIRDISYGYEPLVDITALRPVDCPDMYTEIIDDPPYGGPQELRTIVSVGCLRCGECEGQPKCAHCCEGTHPAGPLYASIQVVNDTLCCICLDDPDGGAGGGVFELGYLGFATNSLGECNPSWFGEVPIKAGLCDGLGDSGRLFMSMDCEPDTVTFWTIHGGKMVTASGNSSQVSANLGYPYATVQECDPMFRQYTSDVADCGSHCVDVPTAELLITVTE